MKTALFPVSFCSVISGLTQYCTMLSISGSPVESSRSSVIVTDFSPNSRGRTQRYSAVFVCSAAGASFNVRISCEVCSKPVSMQTTSARTRIFLELMSRASAERTWQQACSCMAAVAAGSSTRMEYGK